MADVWRAAISSGDVAKLSELLVSAAGSPDAALSVVNSCAEVLLLKKQSGVLCDASSLTATTSASETTLCTLEGVQLLHPRGRFDLEFRLGGLCVTGKAGVIDVSWENIRHVLRLPRPEGFNWGKALDPTDPAGSDLLALPLKDAVPFRKSTTGLILLQPDPKAKHAEVSIELGGVSHKVSGSQGTIIADLLKLLCKIRHALPDRSLFVTRESKSFVRCYHGVNEGSLFPLKQGLLFMKPALFLPRGDIETIVCGRGESGRTRYVDFVVGMEATEEEATKTHEFSNIEREALPALQQYIQSALVAPREREAKKTAAKAKAEEAAEKVSSVPVQDETVGPTATSKTAPTTTSPTPSETSVGPSNGAATRGGYTLRNTSPSGHGENTPAVAAAPKAKENDEEDEEDDSDDESDEDFAPIPGDTDSDDNSSSSGSGSDGGSGDDGGDSDSDDSEDGSDEDKNGDQCDEDPGGNGQHTERIGTENCPVGAVKETQPELKRKRIKEDGSSASAERAGAGNPAREANRVVGHGNIDSREDCVKGEGDPGVSTNTEGGIDESLGEGDSGGAGGEDTESDGEAARPRKKLAK